MPNNIEENEKLSWPEQMKRHDGYCVRYGHPQDETSPQEFMADENDNFDIVHFIDEGIYHVVCVDGTPIGPDAKTLAQAQNIAQADYSEMRIALYGVGHEQLVECDTIHCGEMFDHVRCDGTLADSERKRECLCPHHGKGTK